MLNFYLSIILFTLIYRNHAVQSTKTNFHHKQNNFQYTKVYEETEDDIIAKKLDIAKRGKILFFYAFS